MIKNEIIRHDFILTPLECQNDSVCCLEGGEFVLITSTSSASDKGNQSVLEHRIGNVSL